MFYRERLGDPSFSAVAEVEHLSRRLVYQVSQEEEEERSSKGGDDSDSLTLFSPKFLECFEQELKDLEVERKKTEKLIKKLAGECKASVAEYNSVLESTHLSFEQTMKEFQSLDERILDIGNIAVTIGETLQDEDHQRSRAKEAEQIITRLIELNETEEPDADIFSDPDMVPQRAKLLKNLNDLTRELKDGRMDQAKQMVEYQSSELENHLLRVFTQASGAGDTEKMKDCASILYEFNGGDSCVRKYISMVDMIFKSKCLEENHQLALDYVQMLRDSGPPRVPSESPLATFMSNVENTCKREHAIIPKVFHNVSSVMNRLVSRLFLDCMERFVETVLALPDQGGDSLLVHLQALYEIHESTRALVSRLKVMGDVGDVNFEELMEQVFSSHKDHYLVREMRCLEQLYQRETEETAMQPSQLAGRRSARRSREDEMMGAMMLAPICITLVHIGQQAVQRCLVLAEEHTIPHSLFKIYSVLLEFLGTRAVDPLLDAALVRLSKVRPTRELSIYSEFLQVTQQVNQVRITLESHFHRNLKPSLAVAPTVLDQLAHKKNTIMVAWEDKVNSGLTSTMTLIVESIKRGLAHLQRRNDFRLAEDAFEELDRPTTACVTLVKYLKAQSKEIRRSLDGGNEEAFLEELGRRTFRVLLDHLKRFTISQGMGGLKLKRDMQEYDGFAKDDLGIKAITKLYSILPELANIHLLAPSQLKGLLEDSALCNLSREEGLQFLRLRSDWKPSWVKEYHL